MFNSLCKIMSNSDLFLKWLEGILPFLINLVIPITLLLIYSALKYTVSKGKDQILWLDMSVEVPIDFLCIACTLVITNNIFGGNTKLRLVVGVVLLLLTILVAWISCLLRSSVLELKNETNPSKKRICYAIGLYALVFTWLFGVIWIGNLISEHNE